MNQQELTKLLVDSYKQAPPFIQRFISSGALSKFIEQTRDKYKLHIDVAGRLSDEITMLMVGITDPKEFIQNLAKEAVVPEASLNLIVAEINEKIFLPLREEMRKGGNIQQPVKSSPPQTPVASVAPQAPVRVNAPVPNYAPPPPVPRSPVSNPSIAPLPPKMVMPPASGLPKGSYVAELPKGSRPSTISGEVGPTRPIGTPVEKRSLINLIQKPIESSDKLLEDHEEPHIDIMDTVQGVSSLGQALRKVLPRPAVAPSEGGPPENLPGAIFHPELPKPPISPLNRAASEAARSGEHSVQQNIVAAKPYSVDPYHEPIDGK